MGEGCAAGRDRGGRRLHCWLGAVDRQLGRMLGGWRERVALLVARKADDGCAAHWERVGRRFLIDRMVGEWERVVLLVGREVALPDDGF